MKIEIRNNSITIDGYVNAVGRDSLPIRSRFGTFIEQIVPGAFKRSLEVNKNVRMLLNHDKDRDLGGTDSNLKLFEDNIGLRAIAEITDAEVIEDAKKGKLRGWSFGFTEAKASEEETSKGIKRRFVEDLNLLEVSIINQKKTPCYAGTSIEMRADGQNESIETRELDTEAIITETETETKNIIDYSDYKKRAEALKGE